MIGRKNHLKITPLLVAAAFAVTACEDTNDPPAEPEVATMRLTIGGTQTVNVSATACTVTGGPITLTVNQPRTIVAAFLRADGTAEPLVTSTTFKLSGNEGQADPTPTPATITFTRTGPFAGTLTGTAATTQGSVFLSLFHLEEEHEDFGPCAVTITVQ